MSDFGFKVSLPGYDVKSATPEQCSIHSSYDSFKVPVNTQTSQVGNIKFTITKDPGIGTWPITQIHHGYGYIPAVYFFYDERGSTALVGSLTDLSYAFGLDEDGIDTLEVVPDTQNVTFQLVETGTSLLTFPQTYSFRFSIFANDGE